MGSAIAQSTPVTLMPMDFRRIERFPPYVFSIVNDLKTQARRSGEDVIDLGMGNPD
ncbi:MAG: alanine-synthesizing transaminase, partial [Actinomycetota bacterium]|nr:alanine-synthesizing transaminase [Actinomycetota bacterium]